MLLLSLGCTAIAEPFGPVYVGMSKRALLERIGLPAEIHLQSSGAPSQEIWTYYWRTPQQKISNASFGFKEGKVLFSTLFDATKLLSTDSDADRAAMLENKKSRSR